MKLDEIKAKFPAAEGWSTRLENVHLAFDANGVRGAHFTTVSIKAVAGEEPLVRTGGPYPATQGDFASLFGESLKNALVTIEGREGTIVSRDNAIAELIDQLDAMTVQRHELAAQLKTSHDDASNKAAKIDALTAELATLNEEHAATVAGLQSEIETLRNPPRIPTVLLPAEFLSRFTDSELDAIDLAVENPVARKAKRTLFTRLEINLESPLLAELMGALVAVKLLTTERAAAIMAVEA